MAQSKNGNRIDPVKLIKDDHEKVKALFTEFEESNNKRTKARVAKEAIVELDVHAAIEEEIFYPSFKSEVKEDESQELVLEAEEEHHVVHLLIGELRDMSPEDERFDAKFMVLMENVRHHIKEEEKEMLPKAKKVLDKDRLQELGEQMMERKESLTRELKAAMS